MSRIFLILFIIVLAPSLVTGECDVPSDRQIWMWWDPPEGRSKEDGMFVDKVIPIAIAGNEKAFLAAVTFPYRGRNFQRGSLLVRPKLREAREMDQVGYHFGTVRNNFNGAEIIWTEGFGSGQGTTAGQKSVLYFDGWKPVILHEMSVGDNLGQCGVELDLRECYAIKVAWTFVDLDNDRKDDLIEVVIQQKGPSTDKLSWAVKVNTYLIKDGEVIPTSPSMRYDPNPAHGPGE